MDTIPNPPSYESFIPRFLTYVPGRTVRRGFPGFKTHTQINHAKNAITNAMHEYGYVASSPHRMAIWEFDFSTNTWKLLYDIAPHTLIKNLPWKVKND